MHGCGGDRGTKPGYCKKRVRKNEDTANTTPCAGRRVIGVPERVVMQIMGWSSTAMAARYQHVTAGILADVAQRVGGLIWEVAKEPDESGPEGFEKSR
ncbi:hypothetical protein ACFC0C_02935 [Streptomyces sp. NPDC056178]|uniref:hypothetical protein n=1 Tax=Streptomyces sp. NPDC056178 TaxID=3345735 RepID=UPI0035E1E7ED